MAGDYSRNIADNGQSYAHLLPFLRVGGQAGICTACATGWTSGTQFDRHQTTKKDGTIVCKDPRTLGLIQDPVSGFWKSPGPSDQVKQRRR